MSRAANENSFRSFLPSTDVAPRRFTIIRHETKPKTPDRPRMLVTRRHRGGALREWAASVEWSAADLLIGIVF